MRAGRAAAAVAGRDRDHGRRSGRAAPAPRRPAVDGHRRSRAAGATARLPRAATAAPAPHVAEPEVDTMARLREAKRRARER